MAPPGSVPLLLLLLLLLTSAVAHEYQQLTNVTANLGYGELMPESECIGMCDASETCCGYAYDTTTSMCYRVSSDCRGPGVNMARLITGYNAVNTCPDSACGCPAGFQRYGGRCYGIPDQTPQGWLDAKTKCRALGALPASPFSQQELDQVALAAVQLQTALPLQMVWIDAFHDYVNKQWTWYYHRVCGEVTQPFWAPGQPADPVYAPTHVAYAPPGMAQAEGWYIQPRTALNVPLCELNKCYRPDCPQ